MRQHLMLMLVALCVGLVLQKKQVEIKEVNVKKTGSVVSSNTGELLHVQCSLISGFSVNYCPMYMHRE